jgi:hypothetical protein
MAPNVPPAVCPHCQSERVASADAPRASRYAPDLLVFVFRCECGKTFRILWQMPRPTQLSEENKPPG